MEGGLTFWNVTEVDASNGSTAPNWVSGSGAVNPNADAYSGTKCAYFNSCSTIAGDKARL